MSYRKIRLQQKEAELRRLEAELEALRNPQQGDFEHGLSDEQVWLLLDALGSIDCELGATTGRVDPFNAILAHIGTMHANTIAYEAIRNGDNPVVVEEERLRAVEIACSRWQDEMGKAEAVFRSIPAVGSDKD